MNAVSEFGKGLKFYLAGTKYILNTPGLRRWVVIPFLIDVLLLILGFIFGWPIVMDWVAAALAWIFTTPGGFWYTLLSIPLTLLLGLGFFVVLIFGVYILASVVAAPFNGLLAERTLMHSGVLEDRPFQMGRWLGMTFKMFMVSIIKAIIFAFIGIAIFFLSFVPVVNVVASFLAVLIIAFDMMDVAFEAREFTLGRRLRYFFKHLGLFSGMACALGLTLLAPGLTLLLLPSSVVGAALTMKDIND